jgi:hypothetical protein
MPIEGGRGPGALGIILAAIAILVIVLILPGLLFGGIFGGPPQDPRPTSAERPGPVPPPHGALLWSEPGRAIEPGSDVLVSRALALPAIVELEVTVADRGRGGETLFEWTLREDARGSLRVQLDAAAESARLLLNATPVGPIVAVPASATGRMVLLTVILDRQQVFVWADKWFVGEYQGPPAEATLRLRATGEPGAVKLIGMRAYSMP